MGKQRKAHQNKPKETPEEKAERMKKKIEEDAKRLEEEARIKAEKEAEEIAIKEEFERGKDLYVDIDNMKDYKFKSSEPFYKEGSIPDLRQAAYNIENSDLEAIRKAAAADPGSTAYKVIDKAAYIDTAIKDRSEYAIQERAKNYERHNGDEVLPSFEERLNKTYSKYKNPEKRIQQLEETEKIGKQSIGSMKDELQGLKNKLREETEADMSKALRSEVVEKTGKETVETFLKGKGGRLLAGIGVGAFIISNINRNKGQQSNAELYNQNY